MPQIRITVDGRLALTVEQAATRYKMEASSVRSMISRLQLEPAASLDGRKHLYLAAALDVAVKARPGKGANLRRSSEAMPAAVQDLNAAAAPRG
jgi:hypothetical protein